MELRWDAGGGVLFDSEERQLAFDVAEAGALFGPGVAAVIASLPTPAAGLEGAGEPEERLVAKRGGKLG